MINPNCSGLPMPEFTVGIYTNISGEMNLIERGSFASDFEFECMIGCLVCSGNSE